MPCISGRESGKLVHDVSALCCKSLDLAQPAIEGLNHCQIDNGSNVSSDVTIEDGRRPTRRN